MSEHWDTVEFESRSEKRCLAEARLALRPVATSTRRGVASRRVRTLCGSGWILPPAEVPLRRMGPARPADIPPTPALQSGQGAAQSRAVCLKKELTRLLELLDLFGPTCRGRFLLAFQTNLTRHPCLECLLEPCIVSGSSVSVRQCASVTVFQFVKVLCRQVRPSRCRASGSGGQSPPAWEG